MPASFLSYLFVLFYIINLSCNNHTTCKAPIIHDTVYINKEHGVQSPSDDELTGTTVLKASEKNMEARWVHGLWLDDLKSSECLHPQSETPSPTEITSIKQLNDSILIITANINANCGYNFLGEIEIIEDNTLNLIYHGYGGYASCNCCFGLTYKLVIFKDEENKFDKLKYVAINGIERTSLPRLK